MSDEAIRLICGTALYVSGIWAVAWIGVEALKFISNIGQRKDED